MKPAVLTGEHFMTGDVACAEGALAAGCRFFGGYPITPATEIAEHISTRMLDVGGTYVQMEDEIAAMAAVIGASCAGVKSMTATSGPGFSLMMENIGLAVCTETPCVVVNVQRAGPSTGLPTQGAQGDYRTYERTGPDTRGESHPNCFPTPTERKKRPLQAL